MTKDPRHFLVFTTPNCRHCGPVVKLLQTVSIKTGIPLEIVDATEHPRRAKAMEVQTAPTVFLKNGKTVLRSATGRLTAATVEQWLIETR